MGILFRWIWATVLTILNGGTYLLFMTILTFVCFMGDGIVCNDWDVQYFEIYKDEVKNYFNGLFDIITEYVMG